MCCNVHDIATDSEVCRFKKKKKKKKLNVVIYPKIY